MNVLHTWTVRVLLLVVVLVIVFGAIFGIADNIGIWNGMYFAIVTVTTVGYGDISPQGWAAHIVAVAIMVLIIPLWSSVFSLFAAGLITRHVDNRHEQLKQHIDNNRQNR